jgi:hypothetical protein
VCGQALGYSVKTPDGFYVVSQNRGSIDGAYLDGMSVTHGSPRQHIWSFGAGHHDYRCPCDNVYYVDRNAPLPPSFVGNNYFCEGSRNGAIWDGMDCTNVTACCTFNFPPWFSIALPTPTSDDIEVRLCQDENESNESIHVRLLELYVQ